MINIDKYENILNQGLLLDHYSLLCCIRDGGELPNSKRIEGFINLLQKKGYLAGKKITDLGLELIDNTIMSHTTTTTVVEESKEKSSTNDYLKWAHALHIKLQDKLVEKTGKRQARGSLNGTTYSFLPNANDFSKILLKVIVLYKITDFDKIDKCLMKFVERRIKENNWFPLLGYYMLKNGVSNMVTDLDNVDDEEIDNDSTVNI